jgi:hypothetical protein
MYAWAAFWALPLGWRIALSLLFGAATALIYLLDNDVTALPLFPAAATGGGGEGV